MAHIAVIEELEKANIPIDVIIGSSAGSVVGALYAKTGSSEYVKEILLNVQFWDLIDYNFFYTLQSFCCGTNLKSFLLDSFGAAHFDDLAIPLVVVATDLVTGEAVKINRGAVAPAVHASSALPPLYSPVEIYQRILIDGGVSDPFPVEVAREFEPDLVIAIDINVPLPSSLPTNPIGMMIRCGEIQYLNNYENNGKQADIVIKPEIEHIGSFDDTQHQEIYELSRKAAKEALPKIQEMLKTME